MRTVRALGSRATTHHRLGTAGTNRRAGTTTTTTTTKASWRMTESSESASEDAGEGWRRERRGREGRGGRERGEARFDGFGEPPRGERARQGREDARRRGRGNEVRYDRKVGRRERGEGPTIAESVIGEIVYGTNPVLEALRQNRRALFALYVQEGADGSGKTRGDSEIVRLAEERNVTVKSASKHDLNMACDNKPHQGVVLDAEALEIPILEDLPSWDGVGRAPVWLALDEIVDPQNLGAMLRSAHFLGVDGVVCCAKNSAPFNATVSKASAGAMEAQIVHQTGVMHRFLAKARDEGWDVVGAAADARAENVSDFVVSAPTLLVMGNEGSGLRTNVRRACNRLVAIPAGINKAQGVDSLNVSVAAGILIHRLVSARADA